MLKGSPQAQNILDCSVKFGEAPCFLTTCKSPMLNLQGTAGLCQQTGVSEVSQVGLAADVPNN